MKQKEMKLKEGIRLVSFQTKQGIYVYQDNVFVGAIAKTRLLKACRRK